MSKVTNELLMKKINQVVNCLMHLKGESLESDKHVSKENIQKGIIARDMGIEIWDWPQGVGLYGLEKLQNYFNDTRYDGFLDEWYKRNIREGLPSANINTTAPFLTLVGLSERTGNAEYKNMCLDRANWLLKSSGLPKTKEGGFQHVVSAIGDSKGVSLNDGELWIDTLFMAVLFLNKMGQSEKNQEWISETIKQILIHIKYLFDKQTGLFYHGWSFIRNDNFGGIFWCRGNCWFTFGIVELIEIFGNSIDAGTRTYLEDTYRAQVNALIKLQGPSGLWHTVLDDPSSYEEVSGSAGFAAGILKGIKMGLLDNSFKEAAHKAIAAICEQIADNGTVQNVSAGTGMGHHAEHYKNITIAPMAYGQSLTLLALIEALH